MDAPITGTIYGPPFHREYVEPRGKSIAQHITEVGEEVLYDT